MLELVTSVMQELTKIWQASFRVGYEYGLVLHFHYCKRRNDMALVLIPLAYAKIILEEDECQTALAQTLKGIAKRLS